jgi:plasmid stabilization system protein ParE
MPEDRRPVIWSPEARVDLEEIWSYYAEIAGRQTADNIARKLAAPAASLKPTRSAVAPGTNCVPACVPSRCVRTLYFIG